MAEPRNVSTDDGEFSDWIASARAGDRSALQQIMKNVRSYLLLVANQELNPVLQRKMGPSDVVQETFVQLQQNLDQFQGSTEQELLAWARRILVNGIHDVERRFTADKRNVAREQPLAGDSVLGVTPANPEAQSPGPGAAAIERESQETLRAAIQRLPSEYQEVLRLRTWQRQSFAEVGAQMQRSPDAARMLWTRAVQRLQEEMEQGS